MKLYLLVFILIIIGCHTQEPDNRPNIVLILVDDMGWSDLGCYGSEIATPHIDQLAEEGMRFTNFYNTAKCFPSRATLLTGVYAQDCGYDRTFTNPIRNAVTLGEVLQGAGYRTYWSGKHHGLENPYHRGFNHFYGLKDGAFNHFNPGLQRPGEPKPAQKRIRKWGIDSVIHEPYTPDSKDFYSTDFFTNYALDYLEESKEVDQPFFLYLAYTAPHDPLMAWPKDIAKYQGRYDQGYEAVRKARYQKQLQLGLLDSTYLLTTPTFSKWEDLTPEQKEYEAKVMEVYAAMIDRLDQNIGRLIRQLEKLGYLDNTLLLFASDNGASAEMVELKSDDDTAPIGSMSRWISLGQDWANVANTPYRYFKNYSYEGGVNTPMIAYWPGKVQPNSFSDYPGHFIDFMATFVEVADADYPEMYQGEKITPLRGTSLLPALLDGKTARSEPLFWEWRLGQAMRLDNWKLVRHGLDKEWDLYDLKNDPTESNNLAESNKERVTKMKAMFQEWKRQYAD